RPEQVTCSVDRGRSRAERAGGAGDGTRHAVHGQQIAARLALMTDGTGYALIAMTCYGIGDFIYKRATAAQIKPLHFLAAQSWLFCTLTNASAAECTSHVSNT